MIEINYQITGCVSFRDLRGDSVIAYPSPVGGSAVFNLTIADGEVVTQSYNFISGQDFRVKFENDNFLLCFTSLRLYREYYWPDGTHEILLDPISAEEWVRDRNNQLQQIPMEIER